MTSERKNQSVNQSEMVIKKKKKDIEALNRQRKAKQTKRAQQQVQSEREGYQSINQSSHHQSIQACACAC